MSEVTRALAERGIRIPNSNDGQHRTTCPQCSHTRKKKNDQCLSVQVAESGGSARFFCHHCGFEGGVGGEREIKPRKVYRRPKAPVALTDAGGDEAMLAWFASRGIGPETVTAFGIHRARHWFPQLGEERACIAFPYRHGGELVNVKYRARLVLDGKETKTFAQEKDAERTLYNADEIQADELVIAEGEMDLLACWHAGLRSVVSLPDGAGKTVEQNVGKRLEALEAHADKLAGVARVVLATDADGPGDALAEALALRFGKDRCWRVRWPEGIKDANEMLMRDGADALLLAISQAKPWPMDGVHRPDEYLGEVEDLYFGRVSQPLSCGIHELDALWRIVPGTFNVITGIPNHGKSMFVDQVAVNLAEKHDWKFACFSPEHSPARHLARLAEKLMRKPFDEGPSARMTHRELREAIDWLDQRFSFIRSAEATPTIDWLLDRFRWCAIRRGVNAIIIDPYNEIEASRPREQTETEYVSVLISKLKRFAAAHGATIFMVVHPTKLKRDDSGQEPVPTLYDLSGSAHWRNKADAGVVVHRDFGTDRTQIHVRKIREQPAHGSIGAIDLVFNHRSRRLEGMDAQHHDDERHSA